MGALSAGCFPSPRACCSQNAWMPTPNSAPVRRTSLSMRVQRSRHLLQHQGSVHGREQAWA